MFELGTDEDGEKDVFCVWVPAEPGRFRCLGPDGKPGRSGFNSREVSEAEFWAAVDGKVSSK
jgi:hypothetical protein